MNRSILLVPFLALAAPDVARAQCQIQKLVPFDATIGQKTGEEVGLSGDVLALGTPFDDDMGHWAGSVYVYERQDGAWTLTTELYASDPEVDDRFGFAVDVADGVIVVGARYNQDHGYGTGSAYVFEKVGGAWTETAKLVASDAVVGQFFGQSVSVSGDRVAVGAHLDEHAGIATGAAYVFEKVGGSWVEVARLEASDAEMDDRFGFSISIDGDRLAVGSHGKDEAGLQQSGAVYLFERQGGAWTQAQKVVASDLKEWLRFGVSIRLQGDHLLVGTPFDDSGGPNTGAVYAFRHAGGTWTEIQKLIGSQATVDSLFGYGVDLDAELAVLGSWSHEGKGADSGQAYLYRFDGSAWSEAARLQPSDSAHMDNFSNAVAISGDTVVCAARNDDDVVPDGGAGYVWSAHGLACPNLYAEPQRIRVETGGTQFFTIRAGKSLAGEVYFLLGSASGTSPGIPLGGFVLPLNPDAYLKLSGNRPNQPPFVSTLGVLNAEGKGSARFVLPSGSNPALVGITAHHAYCVLDPTTLQVRMVSGPQPLLLF